MGSTAQPTIADMNRSCGEKIDKIQLGKWKKWTSTKISDGDSLRVKVKLDLTKPVVPGRTITTTGVA